MKSEAEECRLADSKRAGLGLESNWYSGPDIRRALVILECSVAIVWGFAKRASHTIFIRDVSENLIAVVIRMKIVFKTSTVTCLYVKR